MTFSQELTPQEDAKRVRTEKFRTTAILAFVEPHVHGVQNEKGTKVGAHEWSPTSHPLDHNNTSLKTCMNNILSAVSLHFTDSIDHQKLEVATR